LVGVVNAPSGRPGTDVPGSSKLGRSEKSDSGDDDDDDDDDDDEPLAVEATVIVASAWKDVPVVAFTVAVRVIFAPAAALELTADPASSSSLCPVCRLPTLQVALLADAHTANVGAATPATLPMLAIT
jgi:hypothetical protein